MAKMVKPTEVDIVANETPQEPVKKRRTSHGIICGCGSEEVEISNTITRVDRSYPAFISARTAFKKQKCICTTCKREWWRRVKVTEEEVRS